VKALVLRLAHVLLTALLAAGLVAVTTLVGDAYHVPMLSLWEVAHGTVLLLFPLYCWVIFKLLRNFFPVTSRKRTRSAAGRT